MRGHTIRDTTVDICFVGDWSTVAVSLQQRREAIDIRVGAHDDHLVAGAEFEVGTHLGDGCAVALNRDDGTPGARADIRLSQGLSGETGTARPNDFDLLVEAHAP
jgi:hypothetical protein